MFVKIIYRHFVFNQEKYQVCKFRIYRHFVKSVNGSNFPVNGSRLFVQDNCPVQNSSLARRALRDKRAKQLLKLPPRSGDIHCIEFFFHVVKVELDKQALELNITRETYEEFSERVIRTIKNMPVDVVDKIIESMNNRISLVISSKGQRTKY